MKKISDNLFLWNKAALPSFQIPPFISFEEYVKEIENVHVDDVAKHLIRARHADSCEQAKTFMSNFKIIDLPF